MFVKNRNLSINKIYSFLFSYRPTCKHSYKKCIQLSYKFLNKMYKNVVFKIDIFKPMVEKNFLAAIIMT